MYEWWIIKIKKKSIILIFLWFSFVWIIYHRCDFFFIIMENFLFARITGKSWVAKIKSWAEIQTLNLFKNFQKNNTKRTPYKP